MNELLFFTHILGVVGTVFIALRVGKNALFALIALQAILANLFVVKQISLFGLTVTSSDVFSVGGILSLNLLQEYFGRKEAQKAISISLLTLIFFAFMAKIHVQYDPSIFDQTHEAFQTIFSATPRIIGASIATFYIVQQMDVRLFPKLKGILPMRLGISLLCSQFLDTVLFSILGLWGLVESLVDMILLSFLVKCLIILISAPLTTFSKRFILPCSNSN